MHKISCCFKNEIVSAPVGGLANGMARKAAKGRPFLEDQFSPLAGPWEYNSLLEKKLDFLP